MCISKISPEAPGMTKATATADITTMIVLSWSTTTSFPWRTREDAHDRCATRHMTDPSLILDTWPSSGPRLVLQAPCSSRSRTTGTRMTSTHI
jgi:hypothetical protein